MKRSSARPHVGRAATRIPVQIIKPYEGACNRSVAPSLEDEAVRADLLYTTSRHESTLRGMNYHTENARLADQTVPVPRRQRRPGFALPPLMFIVLAVGGALGWWTDKARIQREAVAEIWRNGGIVEYGLGFEDNQPLPPGAAKPQPRAAGRRRFGRDKLRFVAKPWPTWLVEAVGPDFLSNVKAVYLVGSKKPDASMVFVGRLSRLERLSLAETNATDAGMVHLRNLTHLKWLTLADTRVTGAGLVHLEGLTELEHLTLPNRVITDDELSHLARLTRLRQIDIMGDKVTNAGLGHLRDLKRLEYLNLNDTKITSLAGIRTLTQLQRLDLRGTPINDAGLEAVANFRELEELWLSGDSSLTDAGLVHISGLPKLHDLRLDKTRITDAGLDHLRDLPTLLGLELSYTTVTDAGVVRFLDQGGLKTCKTLSLARTKSTLAGARAVKAKYPEMWVTPSMGFVMFPTAP
jgi:hypothetical protein